MFDHVPGLTFQYSANLVQYVHRDVFCCTCTHCGDSRLPDTSFFCKLHLRHVVHGKQYFQAEFDHNNTPFQQDHTTKRHENQYATRNLYARRAKYFREAQRNLLKTLDNIRKA